MEAHLAEYDRQIHRLDIMFLLTGLRLFTKKPKNWLVAILYNPIIPGTAIVCNIFMYMIIFEFTDLLTMVQHVWAMLAMFLIIPRHFNRLVHWDDKKSLLEWYRDLYSRKYSPEYETIVSKQLEKTNYYLKLTLWSVIVIRQSEVMLTAIFPPQDCSVLVSASSWRIRDFAVSNGQW